MATAPPRMPAPELSEDDFLVSLQNLLPPGRAWSRDPDTVLAKLLRGMARAYARVHERCIELLIDAFPATAEGLLPEWEASLGLPDPCAGPQPTLALRRAQVISRLTNPGGQSVPYFIQFAADLGYTISIEEFKPRRFGDPFGEGYQGYPWAFHWEVTAPDMAIWPRLFGEPLGEPYRTWTNSVLECEFRRIMPGHTTLSFVYTDL